MILLFRLLILPVKIQSWKVWRVQKIQSWMLPPRSPGWMPLDYSLWAEIERRVLGKQLKADEPLESYRKRLHMTAKRLPRRIILGVLGKMKENIEATVVSGGKNTKME